MAIPSGHRVVSVPEPLASRVMALVEAGEFRDFGAAAVALIELGLLHHDQRTLPPVAGPPPPTMPRALPAPGGSGPGAPPAPPTVRR